MIDITFCSHSSSAPAPAPTGKKRAEVPKDVGISTDQTSMDIFGSDALAELNDALLQLNSIASGSFDF